MRFFELLWSSVRGFEPPAYRLGGGRSILLSYTDKGYFQGLLCLKNRYDILVFVACSFELLTCCFLAQRQQLGYHLRRRRPPHFSQYTAFALFLQDDFRIQMIVLCRRPLRRERKGCFCSRRALVFLGSDLQHYCIIRRSSPLETCVLSMILKELCIVSRTILP